MHYTLSRRILTLIVGLIFLTQILFTGRPAAALSTPDAERNTREDTDDFVITVKTDETGSSFTIPTHPDEDYSYAVDCDDDDVFETLDEMDDYTCDYANAGTYTVRIRGNNPDGSGFPRIYFNNLGDRQKILTIEQWGTEAWTSMAYAFTGCTNLTGAGSDNPNLTLVTDMSWMFADASKFNGDISSWDTSNVTNMEGMFQGASIFNVDISGWETGNVTNMNSMFQSANAFNQDIGSWDTHNVTNMSGMFENNSAFNGEISGWDTHNVKTMQRMFDNATAFNGDIGSWDTSQVDNMRYMFREATAFNKDLDKWNTGSVTTMENMFNGASAFNGNISSWDTSNVTDMSGMFSNANSFNWDISGWDTGKVTDMGSMFFRANAFDQNLGGWNVSSLTKASVMFEDVTLSTRNYDALLIGWNAQDLNEYVYFSGGHSYFCRGESARTNMIDNDHWSITDGGKYCVSFFPIIYK